MLHNDLPGFGLYIGYFIVAGILPLVLLRVCFNAPFELVRKVLHIVVTMSIFPLLLFFSTWYAAVIAALAFALILYPALALVDRLPIYKRLAVERKSGEFKRSLIIVQLSLAILITIFWGILGDDWQYIAVVAVMAWGYGDAAAALVGKAFGRRRILHPRIEGAKTIEGTLAMYVVAGLAIFLTLLIYAGQSWHASIGAALLVAPACAVVELFSPRGSDTITVPLSAAFLILPLMSIFTHLGI